MVSGRVAGCAREQRRPGSQARFLPLAGQHLRNGFDGPYGPHGLSNQAIIVMRDKAASTKLI